MRLTSWFVQRINPYVPQIYFLQRKVSSSATRNHKTVASYDLWLIENRSWDACFPHFHPSVLSQASHWVSREVTWYELTANPPLAFKKYFPSVFSFLYPLFSLLGLCKQKKICSNCWQNNNGPCGPLWEFKNNLHCLSGCLYTCKTGLITLSRVKTNSDKAHWHYLVYWQK